MRIPLLRGRTFDQRDTPDAPFSIVINESMAHHFWPGENLIGKGVRWAGRHLIVIGVVGDVHIGSLEKTGEPMIDGDVFQLESGATLSAVFVALAAGVLIASGALASYLPARRAARVGPMVALRYE